MTPAPRLPPEFLSVPLAHRTLHDVRDGRPENSIAGAQAAIARGYGIEIDLQLSADGVPMVFHDEVLNRLTPQVGRFNTLSAAELGELRLTYGTEPVPTLEAFLSVVAGQVPLLIELKDQDGALGDAESGMEAAVCRIVKGYAGPVAVMSFNPHMIARCAELAPGIPRGLVTDPMAPGDWPGVPDARCEELRGMPDLDRVGASFVSHDVADLASDRVAGARAAGRDILCWTVRSETQERTARKYADNITFEGYPAALPG